MEIRVKTQDEFRDDHMTIEIRLDGEVEADNLGEALVLTRTSREFNRARVLELEAELAQRTQSVDARERLLRTATEERDRFKFGYESAERKITELEAELERYRRAHVCTSRCSENSHVAFEGVKLVNELREELAVAVGTLKTREDQVILLKAQVAELAELARTQSGRADDNRAWAERAELQVAEAQATIVGLEARLGRVSDAVHGPPMIRALRQVVRSPEQSEAMAEAIRQVRDAVGSPGPSTSPVTHTSQA